tara:strand:+ start:618 stop:1550 length:933 start_codon:yes stop_codon:yes gene_type:complete
MNKTKTQKPTNKEIVENLSALIDENIEKLVESDEWERYLSFARGQHRYSWNNTWIIEFEGYLRERNFTYVRGAKQWNSIGRTIIKGEKAIWILAPKIAFKCVEKNCTYKGKMTYDKVTKKTYCPIDRTHTVEKVMTGFLGVPVFDISQTEGDDILMVTVADKCKNASQEVWDAMVKVAESNGYSVEMGYGNGAHGFMNNQDKKIVVEKSNSFGFQVKTLAHELAHSILHDKVEPKEYQTNRGRYETEAEGVAWIVMNALELNEVAKDNYSFGYIKGWAGDDHKKMVKESLNRIQTTANTILDAIDEVELS